MFKLQFFRAQQILHAANHVQEIFFVFAKTFSGVHNCVYIFPPAFTTVTCSLYYTEDREDDKRNEMFHTFKLSLDLLSLVRNVNRSDFKTFLTAIWLFHNQLSAIPAGTALVN